MIKMGCTVFFFFSLKLKSRKSETATLAKTMRRNAGGWIEKKSTRLTFEPSSFAFTRSHKTSCRIISRMTVLTVSRRQQLF